MEMICGDMDSTDLAQDEDWWRALVSTVMNFLEHLRNLQLLKQGSAPKELANCFTLIFFPYVRLEVFTAVTMQSGVFWCFFAACAGC
jgi:hypothetical protein